MHFSDWSWWVWLLVVLGGWFGLTLISIFFGPRVSHSNRELEFRVGKIDERLEQIEALLMRIEHNTAKPSDPTEGEW